MPKITFLEPGGTSRTLDAEVGQSLMELARDNGVPGIVAECNGSLSCATCHCYLPENAAFEVPGPSEMEEDMLDFAASERRETSRLSCQVIVTEEMDGAVIELPETQV